MAPMDAAALEGLRERAKRDHVTAYWDLTATRAALEGDGNTLTGFAAVFDTYAPIEDWEGTFNERIDRRAFNKTLRDKADQIVSQFNHGTDPVFGELPIGKPSVLDPRREGLWTETPLNPTPLNETLKAAIRSGSLSGMSIQFRVINDEWDNAPDIPTRTIRELELFEFGPVVFPAYPTTTVGLRSAMHDGRIAHDARIYRAGNTGSTIVTTGTGSNTATAGTVVPPPVATTHDDAQRALAAAVDDLERQRERMEGYR